MSDRNGSGREERFVVQSEFALVEVRLDQSANGPRVALRDLKTGTEAFFDPLELESLVFVRHEELAEFLNPGTTRWTGPFDER